MIHIRIVCVGKLKESFYRDAVKEYLKRLSAYAKVEIVEVSDEKTKENATAHEIALIKAAEGERLLKAINDRDYVIGLFIDGKKLSSEEFAGRFKELPLRGESRISLVIGGSLGLSEEVRKRCNETISFSDLTFPHQLMRVILLEQLYRSFRILEGAPYHK